MPVLTSAGVVSVGFLIERRGKHNKWEAVSGPYCSREAAENSVKRIFGKHHITDRELECRVKEVPV